ncbi:DCD domain-containing protein [Drosera capensis]
MDINNQSSSFRQFSDQLRLQSTRFSNLSLNDSIWSIHSASNNKKPEDRVNFDIHIDDNVNNLNNNISNIDDDFVNDLLKPDLGFLDRHDYNSYTNVTPKPINHHHYKIGSVSNEKGEAGLNGGFNKGLYRNPMINHDIHIDDNVNNLNNNLSNIDDDFVNDLLKPDLGFLDRHDYNSYTNVTPKPISHHHYKIGFISNEKGEAGLNGGFNKGLYRNPMINHDHYNGANNGKGSANYKGYYKNFNGRMVENDDNVTTRPPFS